MQSRNQAKILSFSQELKAKKTGSQDIMLKINIQYGLSAMRAISLLEIILVFFFFNQGMIGDIEGLKRSGKGYLFVQI